MKVYLAGAGGMLGEAFYEVLTKAGHTVFATDIDVNENWLSYLDFRDFNNYKKSVELFSPDILIHLGAFTDLEYCELNANSCYVTNTLSVEHAVLIANSLSIPILYISTAGIFDGDKMDYDDWDKPNPLGVYARSKYLGEKFVLERAYKPFVCRAGWMMGGGPKKDKKFINKLISQILAGSQLLHVVDDKDGTPTYTIDFANNCLELINTHYYGLYNMVCGGQTSRFEVASHLLSILKLSNSIKLIPVKSDYFSNVYFAARPLSERLINRKLELRGLNRMRDWKDCLSEYIDSKYSNMK